MSEIDQILLKLEALQARNGADEALSRLRLLMRMGTPSIESLSYTIRYRVKDDYKITEKVSRKRIKNPEYNVSSIRDIIGLRIVTLYRSDAIEIIPRLLDIIFENKPESFFTYGLEEARIYSTNPLGDAQALPERIKSLFESRNFNATIDSTPSNYSSIHLVSWCRGKYNDHYRKIPIEIQIRTAFEDAWAEIDHKLKYKPDNNILSIREERILRGNRRHLNIMKSFVDGASQYADQIKIQEAEISSRAFFSETFRIMEDTQALLRKRTGIPQIIREKLEGALDYMVEAMRADRQESQSMAMKAARLKKAEEIFLECQEELDNIYSANAVNTDLYWLRDYQLPMELALCKFQLATVRQDTALLGDCVRIYQRMSESHQGRAIVAYRHGKVLVAMGDYESAVTQYRRAKSLLPIDSNVSPNHWLRVAIPRNLGMGLWQLSQKYKLSSQDYELKAYISYLKEAYVETKPALNQDVDSEGPSQRGTYKGHIANNLLYYAVEIREANLEDSDLEGVDLDDDSIDNLIDIVKKEVDKRSEFADTLVRAFKHRGMMAESRQYAEMLQKQLATEGVVSEENNSPTEDMLRLAKDAPENR